MSVGERISQLRKDNQISQLQLADALGISRQAVSKWENDLASPDTINLIRLADVLDTEVEYLATGKKPVYTYPVVVDKIKTIEKIVEVKVPETITVERIVNVPHIVEKPVTKIKYRTKYVRNPLEFLLLGTICLTIGVVIGLFF
jgi:transcriptional regulator with XRE-family HTH domain